MKIWKQFTIILYNYTIYWLYNNSFVQLMATFISKKVLNLSTKKICNIIEPVYMY